MRVGTTATKIPTERSFSGYRLMNIDGLSQMLPFSFFVNGLVIDPAVTVTCDFPLRLAHRVDNGRIALQRHRDAKYGQRQFPGSEKPVQSPESGTSAVVIQRLHIHVSLPNIGCCPDDFRKKRLRRIIAMQDTILGAFFIVNDELHRNTCATRPLHLRRRRTITDQVSGVIRTIHYFLFVFCSYFFLSETRR